MRSGLDGDYRIRSCLQRFQCDEEPVANLAHPGIQQVLAEHIRRHAQRRLLIDQHLQRDRVSRMRQAAPAIQAAIHDPLDPPLIASARAGDKAWPVWLDHADQPPAASRTIEFSGVTPEAQQQIRSLLQVHAGEEDRLAATGIGFRRRCGIRFPPECKLRDTEWRLTRRCA